MKKALLNACLLAAALVAVPANAAELLTNGNFSNGLTGWTAYTTANGTIAAIPSTPGSPQPQNASVVLFNTSGTETSQALFLNAGVYLPPYGSTYEGGGVTQSFLSGDGLATFATDIASFSRTGNISGGLLSVLLDGIVLDSYDFGNIAAGATERSTLGFTTSLTAGTHTLSLQATRPFGPGVNVVSQYFDNATLNQSAVPEPATWAMLLVGFGAVGFAMRGGRRQSVAVSYS